MLTVLHSREVASLLTAVSLLAFSALANAFGNYDATAALDRATGRYGIENSFSAYSDIDTISNFDGRLGLRIPLGQRFDLGGGLTYGITLVYSSDTEEARTYCDGRHTTDDISITAVFCAQYMAPASDTNAGLGWRVSLGKLFKPQEVEQLPLKWQNWPNSSFRAWMYVEPDGSRHSIGSYTVRTDDGPRWSPPHNGEPGEQTGTFYSSDSSHLRLRVVDDEAYLEFPTGAVHVFERNPTPDDLTDDCPLNSADLDDCWRLAWMMDAVAFDRYETSGLVDAGNYVEVQYVSSLGAVDQWVLNDSEGRQITVDFTIYADPGGPNTSIPGGPDVNRHVGTLRRVVNKVSIPSWNGGTAEYALSYDTREFQTQSSPGNAVQRGCPRNRNLSDLIYRAGPNTASPYPEYYDRMVMLDTVTLPDGSTYEFDYHAASQEECAQSNDGRLASVTTPIRGELSYTYRVWGFPLSCTYEAEAFEAHTGPGPWSRNRHTSKNGIETRSEGGPGLPTVTHTYTNWPERRSDAQAGNDGGNSTYNPNLPVNGGSCFRSRYRTAVIDQPPVNDEWVRRIHYFNTFVSGLDADTVEDQWDVHEYGLPFRRDMTDGSGRFLSTVTSVCTAATCDEMEDIGDVQRETYVRYRYLSGLGEASQFSQEPADTNENGTNLVDGYDYQTIDPVLVDSKTVYYDDLTGGSPVFETTTLDDPDGMGNHRYSETGGNFQRGNSMTTNTDFNSESQLGYSTRTEVISFVDYDVVSVMDTDVTPTFKAIGNPWILKTSSRTIFTEGGKAIRSDYCYDDFGRKTRQRRYTQVSAHPQKSAGDVVSVMSYDEKSRLIEERIYGGDGAGLPARAGSLCNETYPASALAQHRTETFDEGMVTTTHTSRLIGPVGDNPLSTVVIDRATGLQSEVIDQAGVSAAFEYDAMGRLITKVASGSRPATQIDYHVTGGSSAGECAEPCLVVAEFASGDIQSGDAPQITGRITYDALGRVVQEAVDHSGGELSSTASYDLLGRIDSITTNTGAVTHLHYDALGRMTSVDLPDGRDISYDYNGRQRRARAYQLMGASGEITVEEASFTDRQGRAWKSEIRGPGGALLYRTTTSYGVAGVTSVKREDGPGFDSQERIYVRDGLGQVLSEILPELDGATAYRYDALGNVTEVRRDTDSDGQSDHLAIHEYDDYGRPQQVFAGGWLYKQFTYNGKGQLTEAHRHNYPASPFMGSTDEVVVTDLFQYDEGFLTGRKTKAWRPRPGHRQEHLFVTQRYGFEYDGMARLRSEEIPGCVLCFPGQENPGRSYRYSRYHVGELDQVSSSDAAVCDAGELGRTTIDYAATGLPSQMRYFAGETIGSQQEFGVDPDGIARFSSWLSRQGSSGSTFYSSGAYQYDDIGNIHAIGGNLFSYDEASRIVESSVEGEGRDYAYDAFDNMTSMTGPGLITTFGLTNASDDRNRLATINGSAVTYDAVHGAISEYDGHAISYDDLGKQVGWTTGGYRASYLYDVSGYRVAFEESIGGLGPERTWSQRSSNGQILRDFDGGSSNHKDYLYAGSRLVGTHRGATESVRYVHTDHLGNPRVVVDRDGKLRRLRHYHPFGESFDEFVAGNEELRPDFTGHEFDGNGETHYAKARSYHALLGRFTSPDAIQDGWNLYAYSANNPVTLQDPTGFAPEINMMNRNAYYNGERGGEKFVAEVAENAWEDNAAKHGGEYKCDNCAREVAKTKKEAANRGINHGEVEHKGPRSINGSGTGPNSEILCGGKGGCNPSKNNVRPPPKRGPNGQWVRKGGELVKKSSLGRKTLAALPLVGTAAISVIYGPDAAAFEIAKDATGPAGAIYDAAGLGIAIGDTVNNTALGRRVGSALSDSVANWLCDCDD